MTTGSYVRYLTYPSGAKMKLTISPGGRVLKSERVVSRSKKTKTGRSLARRRRRIH